jgi:N5-(cytidine 5'-diphosphoramidyl)-L-glutamine hydrolase
MRVALTMRVTPEIKYIEPRDSISQDWLVRLREWAMTPFLIPNILADAAAYLDDYEPDILVLTGGDSLGNEPERDRTETVLLEHALKRNLPVLGVCRGALAINNHFGGSLVQLDGHVGRPHQVTVRPLLRDIYAKNIEVNSFHHEGLSPDLLADALKPAGLDEEGNVEAICHHSAPIAGIMWHPERPNAPDGDQRLFARLVADGTFWM